MIKDNKYKKKGLVRLIRAFFNSGKGLSAAWINESAFRQEVYLFVVLSVIALLLPLNLSEKFVLITCMLPVLVVELINSAIESIIDRLGMEEHDLSARAKDMGSAAVFVALLIVFLVWCFVIYKNMSHAFFLS